jgi:hypothetical protein
MFVSRRQFLKVSTDTVAAAAIADKALALTALQPVIEEGNPLGEYRVVMRVEQNYDHRTFNQPHLGAPSLEDGRFFVASIGSSESLN